MQLDGQPPWAEVAWAAAIAPSNAVTPKLESFVRTPLSDHGVSWPTTAQARTDGALTAVPLNREVNPLADSTCWDGG